ncbi:hypothetical protein BGW39_011710 [Mortierella sp. 14UC]|nr:hypothetical protein BGW39_011710 [Mortierella sp. 14UC]
MAKQPFLCNDIIANLTSTDYIYRYLDPPRPVGSQELTSLAPHHLKKIAKHTEASTMSSSSTTAPPGDDSNDQFSSHTPSHFQHEEVSSNSKRTLPLERSPKIARTSASLSAVFTAQQQDPSLESLFSPPDLFSRTFFIPLPVAYKQAVYIPPNAKPSFKAKDEVLLSLMDSIRDFLPGNEQVMLSLGDSSSGKSTFNRYLEYELWRDYMAGGPIPLFINLPALERSEKDLIAERLKEYRFSEAQVHQLEQHSQFVLICDAYDEGQLTRNLHTTNRLNQSGQWNAKLLVTCRTQYLDQDYRDRFVPKATNQHQRAANDLFKEAVIASFSKEQIEIYVELYDYMDKLTTIPNLLDLVKNPFLLTLCLEALPRVVQGKSNLSKLRVTRVQLYDIFVVHWLGVNKRRMRDQKLTAVDQRMFDALKEDGFEENGFDFQRELAAAMFLHQDGRPIVDYTPRQDKISWKAAFFESESRKVLLRTASLLSRVGNQYRFVRRSVLEFFYSCTICPPPASDELSPQASFNFAHSISTVGDHPLSRRSLAAEPSIIQFLAERVLTNPEFKDHLRAVIEQSKSDEQISSQASANAITILVRAGVHFNGADLQGIRIPGADLSGGQFHSTQMQGADLVGVTFAKSWIRHADFSHAQMKGVQFGELPCLQEVKPAKSCAFSLDGRVFVVGLDNGEINMYETTTWATTRRFKGHLFDVLDLAFSPTGDRLLSGDGPEQCSYGT